MVQNEITQGSHKVRPSDKVTFPVAMHDLLNEAVMQPEAAEAAAKAAGAGGKLNIWSHAKSKEELLKAAGAAPAELDSSNVPDTTCLQFHPSKATTSITVGVSASMSIRNCIR